MILKLYNINLSVYITSRSVLPAKVEKGGLL